MVAPQRAALLFELVYFGDPYVIERHRRLVVRAAHRFSVSSFELAHRSTMVCREVGTLPACAPDRQAWVEAGGEVIVLFVGHRWVVVGFDDEADHDRSPD